MEQDEVHGGGDDDQAPDLEKKKEKSKVGSRQRYI
jgi:hypothetical protein